MNIYIDPNDVKNKYNQPLFYKECFLLFAVMVAGKSAESIKIKANQVIKEIIQTDSPNSLFQEIIKKHSKNNYSSFLSILKKYKTGKYSLLLKFIKDIEVSQINLETCNISELETLTGIGKKSSRFFMLYNRKDQRVAVLDVHILKFMRDNGYNTPKTTPNGKEYDQLEELFLSIAEKIEPKINIPDLDFLLWYNGKEHQLSGIIDNNHKLTFVKK